MIKKMVVTLLFLLILIVCIIASILAPLRMLFAIFTNQERAWAIAKSYDFLGNAVLNGKHDEFISRRAYRGMKEGRRSWCVLCKLLDLIDKDHCFKSR